MIVTVGNSNARKMGYNHLTLKTTKIADIYQLKEQMNIHHSQKGFAQPLINEQSGINIMNSQLHAGYGHPQLNRSLPQHTLRYQQKINEFFRII